MLNTELQMTRYRKNDAELLGSLLFLKLCVFSAKTFDAPGSVHKLLFAGEKRVALGANFDPNVIFRGPCLKNISAGTLNRCHGVVWMDVRFHSDHSPVSCPSMDGSIGRFSEALSIFKKSENRQPIFGFPVRADIAYAFMVFRKS